MTTTKYIRYGERVVGLCLLLLCVLLIIQNGELKNQLGGYSGNLPDILHAGEKVDPFKYFSIDGSESTIIYGDELKRYVVFIFSTICPHCEASIPNMMDIADEFNDSGVEVVGVSTHKLEETQTWAINRKVNFKVIIVNDSTFSTRYRISGVPIVLIISNIGVVDNAWFGEITADMRDAIINAVRLNQYSYSSVSEEM